MTRRLTRASPARHGRLLHPWGCRPRPARPYLADGLCSDHGFRITRICRGTSAFPRRGKLRDRLDERGAARALAIAQRHDVPELLARILAGRNVELDAVEAFLDPTIKRTMPDPHVLAGMAEAAERRANAVLRNESVAIFGDYDVDGATSSAVLTRYLRFCGVDPIIHIPDRLFE